MFKQFTGKLRYERGYPMHVVEMSEEEDISEYSYNANLLNSASVIGRVASVINTGSVEERKVRRKRYDNQTESVGTSEAECCRNIYRHYATPRSHSDLYTDRMPKKNLSFDHQGHLRHLQPPQIRKKSGQDSADMYYVRVSVKKIMILVGVGSIICLPTTVAAFTTNPCLTGARAISGVVSMSAGVALIPLQTEAGVDILRWAVRALWAGTSACYIALLCAAVPRNKELYIFCTLLLAAHFVAGFAQTTDTAVEGIVTFGPLVLPICAGLVYLPFRKRLFSNPSLNMATNNIRSEQQQPMDHEIATSNPNGSPSALGPWRGDDNGDMGVRLAVGLMGGNA